MKKFALILACVSGLSLIAPATAHAQYDTYVRGTIGWNGTQDSSWGRPGASGKFTYNNSYVVGGAIGAYGNKNVRGEVEIAHRRARVKSLDVTGGGRSANTGHLRTWSLMLNGFYDFAADNRFNPFVGAGLGIARHRLNVPANNGLGFGTVSGGDSQFAYQVMAGLGYRLSPTLDLEVGYRYFGSSDPGFRNGFKIDYGTHEINTGLRYRF